MIEVCINKEGSVLPGVKASIPSVGSAKGLVIFSALVALTVVGGCGEPTEVRVGRKGIICIGPNITETVFALGQGRRVTAVTTYSDYPPEVKNLERIGGYFDPDLEKITLLAPELIIVQGNPQKVIDLAKRNGTPVTQIYMDSIATIDEGIAILGAALKCEKEADALRAKVKAQLDSVREAMRGLPRPKVLLITGRADHNLNALNTAGGPSFLSELVVVAGGENLYKDADEPYLEASKETVVLEAPEVILEFHAGEKLSAEDQANYIADWDQLPSLPAVKNGRVHLILESYSMRPGPRVALIARRIAACLHPEADLPEL